MVQILMSGGWMMIPIIFCSLVGVAVVIERFMFFYHVRSTPEADQMVALTQEGKYTDALSIAEQHSHPVLRIVSSGIINRHNQPEKPWKPRPWLK